MKDFSVVISTSNKKIFNLNIPSEHINVHYVVVHQIYDPDCNGDIPDSIKNRKDVLYKRLNFAGLSASRNFGLLKAKTKYAYLMDDDVNFDIDSMIHLIEIMENERLDVATCKFVLENSKWPKKYPDKSFYHNLFTAAKVSSIEICVNVEAIRNSQVSFDENFGLGSKYPSGEEYIFISDCIKKSLSVCYVPVVTGIHPVLRSGDDFFSSKEKILAKREMIKRIFGYFGFLFLIAFWMKKSVLVFKKGNIVFFTRYLLWGR